MLGQAFELRVGHPEGTAMPRKPCPYCPKARACTAGVLRRTCGSPTCLAVLDQALGPALACPFCGAPRERIDEEVQQVCERPACRRAAAHVIRVSMDSRGVPLFTRRRIPKPEADRARKQKKLRLPPEAIARIHAHAAAERLGFSAAIERWALSLPEPSEESPTRTSAPTAH